VNLFHLDLTPLV